MSPMPASSTILAVRRIVACGVCGGRRRTLAESAQGLRAHCMGCGAEVAFPFATERMPAVIGRHREALAGA